MLRDGEIVGFVVNDTDITEQKKSQKDLAVVNQQLRSPINSSGPPSSNWRPRRTLSASASRS